MKFDSKQLHCMSDAVRAGALYAARNARGGHIGIALGAADIITTIYANHFRRGTDEFVLSAGHGSALLYSVLKLAGYKIPSLKTFRKFGGLPGHPEYGIDGVAATTGPLGQGIGNAAGLALAKKIKRARREKNSDGFVYCLCSDGDLMEGVAQESIGFAGRYKLDNLIVLWDDNKISIDGTALTDINMPARMRAAGWDVLSVDGNDFKEINYAISVAQKASKPAFIQCKTILGLGSSVAGTAAAHAFELSDSELIKLEEKYTSARGIQLWARAAKRLDSPSLAKGGHTRGGAVENRLSAAPPFGFAAIQNCFDSAYAKAPAGNSEKNSTRELSGKYLEMLLEREPRLLGGSADLAGSTKTRAPAHQGITVADFSGNFINYGVR
ncbi:MAG: hypothetical protein LBF28_02685, partial [Rickettsiales bacterium]|nr:hypothetical protein [Rickettsiales bacterium]